MDMQHLYLSMPGWVQELGLNWYARRLDALYYGSHYARWRERLQDMERWSAADMAHYQEQRLQEILKVAFHQVPWFRRLAAERGWRWEYFHNLAHLQWLPIMEKDPIRCAPTDFLREDIPHGQLWQEKTSGTTGTSLRIYWSHDMLGFWWALQEARVRAWAGVKQSLPRAMVGGRPIIRGDTRQPPYWRYNRRWRQLYLSSYHIAPATSPAYVEAIIRYGSRWITGYGSAIALLGEYLLEHPQRLPLQAVITSGDTVSAVQRQAIEQGFGCKLYDNYGSAEGCCVITECPHGRMHVLPEAGILEIVNAQGEPCTPGEEGEFLCTGLGNDAMPLLRYRTGDYGCWSSEPRCPCGHETPLVGHITGRTDDYLELADGRKVGRLSTAMKKAPHVKQAQIVQDARDHAWLLLVPDPAYREVDGAALVDDVLFRLGTTAIHLEVRLVAEIPPTPVGKHVLVRRIFDNPTLQLEYRARIGAKMKDGVRAE